MVKHLANNFFKKSPICVSDYDELGNYKYVRRVDMSKIKDGKLHLKKGTYDVCSQCLAIYNETGILGSDSPISKMIETSGWIRKPARRVDTKKPV